MHDDTSYELSVLRGALQSLAHELYFKASHFMALRGHSPRALLDADHVRFESASAEELMGADDPFSALLKARLAHLPGGDAGVDLAAILDNWERAESTLNARIRAVFGFLGEQLPAGIAEVLVGPGHVIPSVIVTPGRNPIGGKRADKIFGQPDLVLLATDRSVSLSIEMKVRGGPARATYDVTQHLKYLRLAQELRTAFGVQRTFHALLAPFGDTGIVSKATSWLAAPVSHGEPLVVDPHAMLAALPPKQQEEVQVLGGVEWLGKCLGEVQTRGVDLGRFLDAAEAAAVFLPKHANHLQTQIEILRKFGLPAGALPLHALDPKLDRRPTERLTGAEPFRIGGAAQKFTVQDFWSWSTSDLLSNVTRGVVAEFIVAQALGIDGHGVRDDWADYDLLSPEGTKVEVKSAAYLQSWKQTKLSSISFQVPKTIGTADMGRAGQVPRRQADVYVFALLAHTAKASVDPLELDQWRFYVLPTHVLDARTRSQTSITLRSLEAEAGPPATFGELAAAVRSAVAPRQGGGEGATITLQAD